MAFTDDIATQLTSAVAPILQDPTMTQLFALSGRPAFSTLTDVPTLLDAPFDHLHNLWEPSPKEGAAIVVTSKDSPSSQSVNGPSYPAETHQPQPRFLACLPCRVKKAKCDNIQPVCGRCAKASVECVRPSERRRKRTRKEMEEAEWEDPSLKWSRGAYNDRSFEQLPMQHSNVVQQTQYGPMPFTSAPPMFSQPCLPPSGQQHGQDFSHPLLPKHKPDIYGSMSPPTTPQVHPDAGKMVEALSRPMAYLEGDLGESKTLKVCYFRFSGCTAIHPGFNEIFIKLHSSAAGSHSNSPDHLSPAEPILEDMSSLSPDVSLINTFFYYFWQHWPFLRRERVEERIKSGTMSTFLLHAMNALAVRFAPHPTRKPSQYIEAAWGLVPPLLRLPSTDVVGGLILLSWAEFGESSESGLWNFSGLAIRMAVDIGLHKINIGSPDDDDVCDEKILFWCLFVMDRVLSFGTGRSVTINENIIEIPLPTESDFIPHSSSAPPVLSPFVRIIRLFALAGRIADVMNGSRGCPRTSVSNPVVHSLESLQELQDQLVEFLGTLPPGLSWSVDNFRAQSAQHQGGSFLFLHLWANAVLALIHHPNLGHSPSGQETPISSGVKRSTKISLASSRQIAECLVFADVLDAPSYCANPFLHQCIFIAGVAFIHDAQSEDLTVGVHSEFLNGLAKQNLSALLKALKRMEVYWNGLAYVISVLEQRASGGGRSKADFLITSDKANNVFSLPDAGLLRRFTHVKDLSSPSSNSPRDNAALIDGIPQVQPLALPGSTSYAFVYSTYSKRTDLYVGLSFESLLSSYQVEKVTGSDTEHNFSGIFSEGFEW
ncbi:uncharacterized protein BT62DRAFT_990214 [Guyanagaster necrorhizus]|uniref:Zn(2)-C6 fungal-type domain-containing protein n=1 Tax=Guyanagaster necrorhizus TaxID=856835 RepID=A0A9P7W1T0_9AGAR|nr:uncharacterized protein BT62DRAFT_990214 [Guyanagaster necrorhizus MCA 3950]KAG7451756.1 hypothetical protein BT62DRAFT_990214 [Guyanagaster necrorhizus MCA 3950]